jgi:phosphoadenosine phosphosulfate reductase
MPVSTSLINKKITTGFDLKEDDLITINRELSRLEPKEILEWAIDHLPNLYQTTAFGLTGK